MPKTFRIIALSLVGLALLLAIIAIGIGRREPAQAGEQGPAAAPTAANAQVVMVVAARDLPAGKSVSLTDFKSIPVPALPAGATGNLYQFDGAMPAREILADTPLRSELFLQGLSSQLAAGERAIAVAVDEISGVANHVAPGDFVDVFVALPAARNGMGSDNDPAATRMIASRLRVLSYGQDSLLNQAPAADTHNAPADPGSNAATDGQDSRAQAITARSQATANGSQTRASQASSAVLAVPPDQAGSLLLGAQEGRLFLALRNPADTTVVDPQLFNTPATLLPLPRQAANAADPATVSADDRAYAGITLNALTGKARGTAPGTQPAPAASLRPAPRRERAAAGNAVQIIRGSDAPRPLTVH
ncbi:MAG: Flp pilus assembly protein CpaB [Stenotrophomonas sp.]